MRMSFFIVLGFPKVATAAAGGQVNKGGDRDAAAALFADAREVELAGIADA